MDNRRALVVEDDTGSQRVVAGLLKKLGFDVRICENGAEGLYFYLCGPSYNVILLDLVMPDVDGYQLVRVVENLLVRGILHDEPRIIVQTAVDDVTSLKSLVNCRCVYAVHTKPLLIDELVRDITRATDQRGSQGPQA